MIAEKFDLTTQIEKLEEVYLSLCERRPARSGAASE
jgi:hypothetical protein